MFTLKGKLVGAEVIKTNMLRVLDSTKMKLRDAIADEAQKVAAIARAQAPKKTGALAGSIASQGIEVEDKRIHGVVGTPLFYGKFQESGFTPNPRKSGVKFKRNPRNAKGWALKLGKDGGRQIYANPYLKPAIAERRSAIRARIQAVLDRI